MGTIKDRLKELEKAGKKESLTSVAWEPKNGDVIAGELVYRELIKSNKSSATFDKVTLRTDAGIFDTILSANVLPLAQPRVQNGDILVIKAIERKDPESSKVFMDKGVEIYHVEHADPTPF